MFKFVRSVPSKPVDTDRKSKPSFGTIKITPRLESAFVFPAPSRPKGLSLNGSKKGSGPISKKL